VFSLLFTDCLKGKGCFFFSGLLALLSGIKRPVPLISLFFYVLPFLICTSVTLSFVVTLRVDSQRTTFFFPSCFTYVWTHTRTHEQREILSNTKRRRRERERTTNSYRFFFSLSVVFSSALFFFRSQRFAFVTFVLRLVLVCAWCWKGRLTEGGEYC
jgi:hypothetical protein